MTENASSTPSTPTPALTDRERTVWGVNRLLEMDRHDLAAELAESAPAAPAPVDRGTRAAHRVALLRRRR